MYYRSVGDIPRKRHSLHRRESGVYFEELMGEQGFSGTSSLLYHRHSPSAITAIDTVAVPEPQFNVNQPLRPHHLRTGAVPAPVPANPVTDRQYLLGNDDIRVAWVVAHAASPLYRNAAGDELLYVQSGAAVLESVFGTLPVRAGDYVSIPTSTTHRWLVAEPVEMLVVEARGHIEIPSKYLTKTGQLLEGAPFCERDFRVGSDEPVHMEGTNVAVVVRTRAGLTSHTHQTHPFDVVGWDGCLYPWAFNIQDFEPIVGRVHQPPPVHQNFAGPNFVVCSFVPRLYDFDPDAVKIPYHHANVDSDEVLFYSDGDFMSRTGSGISKGSISLHPAGFIHGPQPGSLQASMDKDRTYEYAVMIDTFRPLGVTSAAEAVSDPEYPWSWSR